jgi:hypothetical protein
MLFVWGPILASHAFTELHDKAKNEAYLLLPASALEKTVARLLLVTLGFFLYLLVFMTASAALIEGINWLVFRQHNRLFVPFSPVVGLLFGHFIVSISMYFLGAAWFRKQHFLKTALTLTAIPLLLAMIMGILIWAVFGGTVPPRIDEGAAYNYYLAHTSAFLALLFALKALYFWALPVFCWWVAWMRVRETQVSHGV